MHDPLFVAGVAAVGDLAGDPDGLVDLQRRAGVQYLPERLAVDVLEDEVRGIVVQLTVVDDTDVRVAHPGRHRGLAAEAGGNASTADILTQHLDGHGTRAELHVTAQPHLAEASPAEQADGR